MNSTSYMKRKFPIMKRNHEKIKVRLKPDTPMHSQIIDVSRSTTTTNQSTRRTKSPKFLKSKKYAISFVFYVYSLKKSVLFI